MFEGYKLFWRTQTSIYLHLYLHDSEDIRWQLQSSIVEVVGLDPVKQRELPRLYLNYSAIYSLLHEDIRSLIKS